MFREWIFVAMYVAQMAANMGFTQRPAVPFLVALHLLGWYAVVLFYAVCVVMDRCRKNFPLGDAVELKLKPFLELCDRHVGVVLDPFGFAATASDSHDDWCVKRYYQMGTQYIAITANSHFRDGPPYCGTRLGDGSLDWPEYDWNGIALWHLVRTPHEYPLDSVDDLPDVLASIAFDLQAQASDFLAGDLTRFHDARSRINSAREPFEIHEPNTDGKYETRLDAESSDLKKRFS